jgi:AraC-like DNA-binding protein
MSDPLLHYVLQHMSVKTNVCTRQKFETGYVLGKRTVPDYNFIYVIRGEVDWVIDRRPWRLKPGHLVIVPPSVEHYAQNSTRKITLGSTHVEAHLPGGQDVFSLLQPPRFQKVRSQSWLDIYLRGFIREFDRSNEIEEQFILPCWGELITRELFRDNGERGLLKPRIAEPLVATLLEEMDRRISKPVTLAELARISGFSPQHLNRIFQKVLGMTPLQYLLRTRMQRAAALLKEDRLTVIAIAKLVGFDDPFYFSRMFKFHSGQSPAQYRATARSDSPSPSSPAAFTRKAS